MKDEKWRPRRRQVCHFNFDLGTKLDSFNNNILVLIHFVENILTSFSRAKIILFKVGHFDILHYGRYAINVDITLTNKRCFFTSTFWIRQIWLDFI